MTQPHLVMIGCGRMGGALLTQWLATGAWKAPVSVVKPTESLPAELKGHHLVRWIPSLAELPADTPPSVVVLAVKPQTLPHSLPLCASVFGSDVPYFTIAAGKRLTFYQQHLGERLRLIRLMPNTPSLIGMGMTAMLASPHAADTDHELAEALMRAVGEVVWVPDEQLLDVATAVAGSGPAYVFYFMECLISAAIDAGLDEATARLMVVQTLHGSSELAYLSGEPLAVLRHDVTSPGGTTEAALSHLMRPSGQLRLMQDAIAAALQRAQDLAATAQ
jgi:pyrroline-5-carboxylate reductase